MLHSVPHAGQGSAAAASQQGTLKAVANLASCFYTFDDNFELAASPLPQRLIPEFGKARARLLSALSAADKRGLFTGTVAGDLLNR